MARKIKKRRTFTEEFKNQIDQLHNNGKKKYEIIREYDLSSSVLNTWIKQSETTGSFKVEENQHPLEKSFALFKKK